MMAATLPPALTLGPFGRAAGTVALPGSKSISNRTLLLAALASGTTALEHVLDADDTMRMLDALSALGVPIERAGAAGRITVHGVDTAFPCARRSCSSAMRARRSGR